MLLRKLEAYGFKSFADKTELEFGLGITAVVGPNGSGKSNISDAIRWALGEQSIKTLRGAKMEDVIFTGSSKRRPLGVAEVSLVFDNTDGLLSIDFNEVVITRRVFRSGDSEYYINKSPCRLKDIHDLLADTGLGKESMTVIGQNKIDELLNTKPEERRLIFEEAAGIMKFKNRKKESLRKLNDTEQNLVRVRDLMSELEQQLEPLLVSARRTSRYNELFTELTACQVTLLYSKYKRAEKMLESAKLEQVNLTDIEIAANTKLITYEAEKEELLGQLADHDQEMQNYEAIVHKTGTEIERFEGKIALIEERAAQSCKEAERLKSEQVRLEKRSTELAKKAAALKIKLDEKTKQESDQQIVLAEQANQQKAVIAKILDNERAIEVAQEKSFGHLQEAVTENNNLLTAGRDLAIKVNYQMSLEKEYNTYITQQKQAKAECEKFQITTAEREAELLELTIRMEEVSLQKQHTEAALNEAIALEKQSAATLQEANSRLKILISMQQQYEGFSYGIKNILKSTANWRAGVCGAVAQILSVPKEYVTAIEIALGNSLQNIITDNEEVAKQAIEYLKRNNFGRATFLPLNTLRISRVMEAEQNAVCEPEVLGLASKLVTCEERYRPVVEFLLGRTIVTENIDFALKIACKSGFSLKIATLDGEIVYPGGSLSGGSSHRREASFFSRTNEIEAISSSLDTLKENHINVIAVISKQQSQLEEVKVSVTLLQEQRQEAEIHLAELAVYKEKLTAEIKRVDQAVETLLKEIEGCSNEQLQLQANISASRSRVLDFGNRDADHKSLVEKSQHLLKQLQNEKEQLNHQLTDAKITISTINQEIVMISEDVCETEKESIEVQEYISKLVDKNNAVNSQIDAAKHHSLELIMQREQLEGKKVQTEILWQTILEEKSKLLIAIQKLDIELKELRRKCADAQNRLHEMQLIEAKYVYEANYSREQLQDQFGINIDNAQKLIKIGSNQELTEISKQLEQQIAELGAVNPNAIEEYKCTQERYDFYMLQLKDLKAAQDYLASVIKDIDRTMAKQFSIAFEIINAYFGEIFGRLFGGGKAYLNMIEPENILETGIDVIVQPPGKKLQNLSLLSGGERAMTVIALLFAFLKYRPAPFCVVDEIDAALDEANVDRFSKFLKDYAQNTQFIIVTHRKGTMEVANAMYGITMEEAGVSRLISVKFREKPDEGDAA